MKPLRIKLPVIAMSFFLAGLVGCHVQETTPSLLATDGINQELVNEVESITEPQVQKIAFTQMLTDEEKTFVFKKRILQKIDVLPLTVEQKDHLDLLLSNMTPAIYTNSEKGRKSVYFLTEWTQKGKLLFDEATLFDIVASLSPRSEKSSLVNKVTAPPATASCSCSSSSDWCGEGYDCTYIPSCNARGCGTFLAYTCSGHCDRML